MVKTRKISVLLVVMMVISILFLTTGCQSQNYDSQIPEPTDQFYVNDFANIIDDKTEREMVEKAKAYSDSTGGVQVVVTTVKTIGNADPVKYTTDMYNKYGIGKNNMGVLIMLSVETRDIQMREGENIRKYISASNCGDIIDDYGLEHLSKNNFEKGLYEIQNATIKFLEGKSLDTEKEIVISTPSIGNTKNNEGGGKVVKTALLVLAITACLLGAAYGINIYSKAKKEKKEAERIEMINNSEIVQKLKEKVSGLETSNSVFREKINDTERRAKNEKEYLEQELVETQKHFSNLEERYKRAIQAYPDLDEKVDAIFAKEKEEADKAAAKDVEDDIKNVLTYDASRNVVDEFADALTLFEDLTYEQKQYVSKELVSKLKEKYTESVRLQKEWEEAERIRRNKEKAAEVQKLILAAIALSATRHSLSQIRRAAGAYDNLSTEQRQYVTADINALNNALRRAQRDQDEYEEEERRRRRAEEERRRRQREEEERRRRASYSSSSFSSGSSFGGGSSGFGGRSGGHGAGRKF